MQKKVILFSGDEISFADRKKEELSDLMHTDLATLITRYFAVVLIADSLVRLNEIIPETFNNYGTNTPYWDLEY